MRHLLTTALCAIVAIAIYMNVDWSNLDFSLSMPTFASTTAEHESERLEDEYDDLWMDTVMFVKGHSFGYSGDVSMWDGWYFDSIPVGNDNMLSYDSVGPSTLKLSLVTRTITVDMGDSNASDKIKNFMNPISGFKRCQKSYEAVLDSFMTEKYGTFKCMGYFSACIDYADSSLYNSGLINRFICDLTGISKIETAKVPGLSAFYAGFNPTKCYRPVYSGNTDNIQNLSDFLANRTFENWKRGGDTGESSNGARLEIRSHIANSKFLTVSVYDYERIGTGHGGYTETFHTMDMATGTALSNKDIFKSNTLEKVKMRLFEVMLKDKHYLEWHEGLESVDDVEPMIEVWQSPNPSLKGTEWEEHEIDFKFELPDAALTEEGIVFSFQPYEIDCWAAGAYHFVVPYNKLMPYLTTKAKRLIDGVTF